MAACGLDSHRAVHRPAGGQDQYSAGDAPAYPWLHARQHTERGRLFHAPACPLIPLHGQCDTHHHSSSAARMASAAQPIRSTCLCSNASRPLAEHADQQRQQLYALAPPQRHAQQERDQRDADDARGPGDELHRHHRLQRRQQSAPASGPRNAWSSARAGWSTPRSIGASRCRSASNGSQRLEGQVPQCVADQRAEQREQQADTGEAERLGAGGRASSAPASPRA